LTDDYYWHPATLAALADRHLTGRSRAIFEAHEIAPLRGAERPSAKDTASKYRISEKRVHKLLFKARGRIRAAAETQRRLADMAADFNVKRQIGGISFQSEGRFVDANELPKAYSYSTSVNSAASAASTKDIKNEE
jgi:hypothetical protein